MLKLPYGVGIKPKPEDKIWERNFYPSDPEDRTKAEKKLDVIREMGYTIAVYDPFAKVYVDENSERGKWLYTKDFREIEGKILETNSPEYKAYRVRRKAYLEGIFD